jgi:hypothetical protein
VVVSVPRIGVRIRRNRSEINRKPEAMHGIA